MRKYTVQIPRTFTSRDMSNWLITAIEGGSGYWCDRAYIRDHKGEPLSYQDDDLFEKHWRMTVHDAEDGEVYTVSRGEFALAINKCPEHVINRLLADDHEYDAMDADAWFQCAIFKEVLYG